MKPPDACAKLMDINSKKKEFKNAAKVVVCETQTKLPWSWDTDKETCTTKTPTGPVCKPKTKLLCDQCKERAKKLCDICRTYPITQATASFDQNPKERQKSGHLLPWDVNFETQEDP